MRFNSKNLLVQRHAIPSRTLLAIALPFFLHLQAAKADTQSVVTGNRLLDVLAVNGEEALRKGQRNTFQEIIDSYIRNPEVKAVALYPRSRLMNYRSGLVSVGKPFVHKKGELENPNEDPYEATAGRYQREDWSSRDMHESPEALKHIKKKKDADEACDSCHYLLDENLAFDDKGRANLPGGRFIQKLSVQESCIQCHDNWKPGEPAGYLELQFGKP